MPDRTLSLLSAKEVYVRYISRARRASGLSYYVVPVATTQVAPPIPARCYGEQLSTLERQLPHVPRSLRVGTLALEAGFLNQMRHDRRPQAGVCLVSVGSGGGSGCSYTVSDIEEGRAIESAGGPEAVAVTWGLVPDGVATVTIAYPRHGRDGRAVTATGKVTNNVFIIPNHGRWLTNATITWRSVMGAVIKTVSP